MTHITTLARSAALTGALLVASLAHADTVVVMAPGAAALTKDQVASVYLGRSPELKPVDLPDGTPTRDAFYKKATERDAAQIKAVWSRVVFTGKGQPPKEMPDASAVKKAVAADPKAIGYIDKSAVDPSVKVVYSVE